MRSTGSPRRTSAFTIATATSAGLAELKPHIAAAQRFMPGMRMRRNGDVRHCQGTVLADFVIAGPDGIERASGTNVFVFGPAGRIESATGFMNPAKSG